MKKIVTLLTLVVFSLLCHGQANSNLNTKSPIFSLSGLETTSQQEDANELVQRFSTTIENIKSINFNPSLSFNSQENIKALPVNIDGFSKLTIISVFQPMVDKEMLIWSNSQDGKRAFLSTHKMAGPAGVDSFRVDQIGIPMISTVTQFWGNGNRVAKDATLMLGGLTTNASEERNFEGLIPEIEVYNRSLSKEEKAQVETKLALKYGITLKKTHYRSSTNQILWNYKENEAFSHRIAGIGRDDNHELNQMKSKSTAKDAYLQIGLKNGDLLPNEQFLIWGDDNKPFALTTHKSELNELQYLQRQWKIVRHSNEEEDLATEIKVDFSSLKLPKGLQPYLIITDNPSAPFNLEKHHPIPASTIKADNIAYFDFNQWDMDKSGSNYFTFGFKSETLAAKSLKIYPNPAETTVTFDIALKGNSYLDLKIYDVNGKAVYSVEEDGQRFYQFQRTFLHNGTYIAMIRTKFGRLTKEFIILKE